LEDLDAALFDEIDAFAAVALAEDGVARAKGAAVGNAVHHEPSPPAVKRNGQRSGQIIKNTRKWPRKARRSPRLGNRHRLDAGAVADIVGQGNGEAVADRDPFCDVDHGARGAGDAHRLEMNLSLIVDGG